jgi:hypothetical protein
VDGSRDSKLIPAGPTPHTVGLYDGFTQSSSQGSVRLAGTATLWVKHLAPSGPCPQSPLDAFIPAIPGYTMRGTPSTIVTEKVQTADLSYHMSFQIAMGNLRQCTRSREARCPPVVATVWS